MDSLIAQVLSILTEPSGDLIYHLVQVFSALATLMLAIVSRRSREDVVYRRFMLGIIVVLISQLMLFLISTFGWRGLFDTHLILPVLDRVVNALCLAWIVWMWISPETWKAADYALIGINTIIAILFIVNLVTWLQIGPVMDFNSSWQDLNWANLCVLIIIAGLVGLIMKKPDGWGIGVGFLAINLTGYVAHLVLPTQSGDFSGIIRLVQVFTYPLIPVLTRRFPQVVETFLPAPKSVYPAVPSERTRFSAERRTIESWLQLHSQDKSESFARGLVKAIGQTMVADISMFLLPPDPQNQVVAQIGYDLIRQDIIPGVVIKGEAIPEISRAFNQNQPLIMSVGGNLIKDLRTMRDVLGLKAPANLLFVPVLKDEKAIAGLLISSPYSTRLWDITDESFLLNLADGIAPIYEAITHKGSALVTTELANMDADTLREKYSQLSQEFQAQAKIIEDLRSSSLPGKDYRVGASVPEFSGEGDMAAQISYLESELHASLDEISRLKNSSDVPQPQSTDFQDEKFSFIDQKDSAFFFTIIDGIRNSFQIVNAKDLSGEGNKSDQISVVRNSLDEMRKKFELLSSFIKVQKESKELTPQPINIHTMIDKVLLDNVDQFKEKSVVFKTEIPEQMKPLQLNPTLFQEVFSKLVSAAISSSPKKGVITLTMVDHKIKFNNSGSSVNLEDLNQISAAKPETFFSDIPGMGMDVSTFILTQTMLQKLGGNILVENNEQGGKTVTLEFAES